MVERKPLATLAAHFILLVGVLIVCLPVYVTLVASTQTLEQVQAVPMSLAPGTELIQNYQKVLTEGTSTNVKVSPVGRMMWVSLIVALVITVGKIILALMSAFALTYFRFPLKQVFFWMIFLTLMLPVEVRILPTYKVVSDLGLLNSYYGLTVPLLASATATFLFRQFFLTVPDELIEAARIDGASPLRFFRSILLPLSKTNIAALFVILFIYGWNQYLWPLLMTTDEALTPIVVGIKKMIAGGDAATEWPLVMATATLAMLPPVIVVVLMQKWFIKGLVDTEK